MMSRELINALAKAGRVEILRTLKAHHDRHFTINELSRASRVPVMTTWRAVKELKDLGFVKTRKVGNATSVWITEDTSRLRSLKSIPDTDPNRAAATSYAGILSENGWLDECKIFGTAARGDHSPGEEVDIAVIYDDSEVSADEAKASAQAASNTVKGLTNVSIVPLCVSRTDMNRRGGLGAELRDKETVWKRHKARN